MEQSWEYNQLSNSLDDGLFHPQAQSMRGFFLESGHAAWVTNKLKPARILELNYFLSTKDYDIVWVLFMTRAVVCSERQIFVGIFPARFAATWTIRIIAECVRCPPCLRERFGDRGSLLMLFVWRLEKEVVNLLMYL